MQVFVVLPSNWKTLVIAARSPILQKQPLRGIPWKVLLLNFEICVWKHKKTNISTIKKPINWPVSFSGKVFPRSFSVPFNTDVERQVVHPHNTGFTGKTEELMTYSQ